jgi:hypothetical protein
MTRKEIDNQTPTVSCGDLTVVTKAARERKKQNRELKQTETKPNFLKKTS